MHNLGPIGDALLELWNAMVNPSFFAFATIGDEVKLLVLIGALALFIGIMMRLGPPLGTTGGVVFAILMAISLIGDPGGPLFVIRGAVMLGVGLRLVGGLTLAATLLYRPALAALFLALVVASILVGFIWLPTLGADEVMALKLVIIGSSCISCYITLRSVARASGQGSAEAAGMAVLVCTAGLVDLSAVIPTGPGVIGVIIGLLSQYCFAVGLAVGTVIGVGSRVTQRR
jgi:hypothetical protein